MSTKELKERIHSLVEQVPEDYLETVNTYLTTLSTDDIVPELGCTIAAYNRELNSAIARHQAGASIPHEEAMSIVSERLQKYRHED